MTRTIKTTTTVLALAILLAACGGGKDGSSTATTAKTGTGGAASGAITIDGSSTVAPISEAIAEEFRTEEKGVKVSVGTSGTGGGFKRFCADEIDIADASRPIKDEEKAACAAKGVTFTEFRIGLDGLAVVTSAKNTFLKCLSISQLASIFKDGGAKTWDQVDSSFPKEKVAIFAPGTDSGTYDFFNEKVLGDQKKPESLKPRSDYTASEDDNVLVQGIEGEKNSWGYFGFAYFKENAAKLKDIQVKGTGACVSPSDKTVESGEYPLSRPLFIYVKGSEIKRPEVAAFVEFYLRTTPDLIKEIGYTPVQAAEYIGGLAKLKDATR